MSFVNHFGLVLIEAMQVGVSVIGSNRGGALEIIEDGVSGLLFDYLDAKDLAQKIELLYKDSKLKNSIAINGEKRAKELFDSKKQFIKMENILKEFSQIRYKSRHEG